MALYDHIRMIRCYDPLNWRFSSVGPGSSFEAACNESTSTFKEAVCLLDKSVLFPLHLKILVASSRALIEEDTTS
jgi:hypothetical protein